MFPIINVVPALILAQLLFQHNLFIPLFWSKYYSLNSLQLAHVTCDSMAIELDFASVFQKYITLGFYDNFFTT